MVDKPKPVSLPGAAPQASPAQKPYSYDKGQWTAKPMTFLGMYFNAQEASKLWNIMIQNICNVISHEKEKAVEAIRKMRPDQEDSDS